jgi:hypothetical protein
MANTIERIDAANLFVGDDDPSASLHLKIKSVGIILDLEEATMSHKAGGHVMTLEMGERSFTMGTLKFSMTGIDTDVMTRFMPSSRIKYTVRANLRDLKKDIDVSLVAIVEGRMVRVTHKDFEKESDVGSEFEIKEIVNYELYKNGQEIFWFDYFAGPSGYRRNGQPMFPELSRNLGLV